MKKPLLILLTIAICIEMFGANAYATKEVYPLYENSWRYENGLFVHSGGISLFSNVTPWCKQGDSFYNDVGALIEGAIKKGIDVSHHQGTIDWERVKDTDVDFAIIRCGYGDNYTQYDDREWIKNANACTKLDIPFGVYIYSYAASIAEAQSEAAHVLRLIEGYELSYPIYLDLEDEVQANLSTTMLGDIADTFCNIIQAAGYDVGIYASKYWWSTKLTDSAFTNDTWFKWVAQYNSECTYTGEYNMWQATSSGIVAGINGNVDINFLFEDIAEETDYSYPNTYVNTGDYPQDIVSIAKTQVGYTELTNSSGTPVIDSDTPYYTKYGDAYGNSTGHWCAFFVLWCANEADIPTSIICKSALCGNCDYFMNWFKDNRRWQDSDYIPSRGDLIFFDWDGDENANHIGIVDSVTETHVITIEGNTGGENGYMVMERQRNEDILGYGVPDYELKEKINGYSLAKQTAYMLPDSTSATVWETWTNDELQILCEDGDYYLVLYPYMYTGKFVIAYVPKSSVTATADIPDSKQAYDINTTGTVLTDTTVYHNASTDDLMSSSTNHKVRATLEQNDEITVLFEESDFYFIRTNGISGYVLKSDISLATDEVGVILGDVNGDLKINSADAGLILRYDAGIINLVQSQIDTSDVNKDGKIDSADAGLILRYDAGIIQNFN